MREILFRGKRTDNGEWVHGYYIAANYSWHKHGVHRDWIVTAACSNGGWFALHGRHPVVADTVGQYTGLTDKNGTKIFEGDVVRAVLKASNSSRPLEWPAAPVVYKGSRFGLAYKRIIGFVSLDGFAPTVTLEVIGNIYDNGELIQDPRQPGIDGGRP